MAAGLPGGTLPLPCMDSINAANQQMGNRAFLRWVGRLLARREDRCQETYAGTIMEAGLPGAGWPAAVTAPPDSSAVPLQFMSNKRKKKGELMVEDTAEERSEASPGRGRDRVLRPCLNRS